MAKETNPKDGNMPSERIAAPLEAEALRIAGWKMTKMQTLWFHPLHTGMYSVDEAIATL
jgi:hypothetical protein